LNKANIKKIVKLKLQDLEKRLQTKWYMLQYDEKIINHITKNVYNPEYWAREIRRYIIDKIEDEIAILLIKEPKENLVKLSISKDNLIVKI